MFRVLADKIFHPAYHEFQDVGVTQAELRPFAPVGVIRVGHTLSVYQAEVFRVLVVKLRGGYEPVERVHTPVAFKPSRLIRGVRSHRPVELVPGHPHGIEGGVKKVIAYL